MTKESTFWLTTDTHFGHNRLTEYNDRPENFSELIMERHKPIVRPQDILIHLGDFCMGNDARWHTKFMYGMVCKKWLIRGNHDKKSDVWYLTHGWDFVGEVAIIKRYGLYIMFSHVPWGDYGHYYDINIHGHFHNNAPETYEVYLLNRLNEKHKLLSIEDNDYHPVKLQKFVGG